MTQKPEQHVGGSGPEGGGEESLERDVSTLRAVLRNTGRVYRAPMLFEGLLWFLVTLGAVVASCLLVAALAPQSIGPVAGWMLLVGLGAALAGAAVALIGFVKTRKGPKQVAALLQRHNRSFRNDLVAALEFGQRLLDDKVQRFEFSEAMARAHVQRTTREVLRRSEEGHLGHLLPRRSLAAPAMSLAGCVVLLAIPIGVDADWTLEVLTSSMTSNESDEELDDADEVRPVVGDLTIYYAAPGYTGLGREVDASTTGHIEAFVGTEVTIEGRPLVDESSAIEIVIETDEGTKTRVLDEEDTAFGRQVSTSFVALEEGTYHFRSTLDDGTIVVDDTERRIELEADEEPDIEITSHDGEIEVSPDDVLDIEFEIADDFGLASASQLWHFAGDDENPTREELDLPELANEPEEASGDITFDLEPLALQPKDVVIFAIEATDNNSLTGPGEGRSEPLRLRVSSPEDKHIDNIARQQQLLESLLDLLADYLENPVGEREALADDSWKQRVDQSQQPNQLAERRSDLGDVHAAQGRILEEMGELDERLEDDPLMRERDLTLFASLRKQLDELHEEGDEVLQRAEEAVDDDGLSPASAQPVADYAADAEETLEKGILGFEELLASQKMDAIEDTAGDIDELKDRLKELLERYKETSDPELKKAIRREIQRLKQRMAELMQRMQMQLQELPEEHMNMEAIEQQQLESDTEQMADSLEQIEQMLEDDDIDGALAALDEMDQGLDALTEQMGEQFDQAQPQGLSELDEKVGELMDKTNDLEQAEKDLERDTAELNDELREERKEQIEQMLDEFTDELLERVERQRRALSEMEQRGADQVHQEGIDTGQKKLDRLEKMLRDHDIEQSLERAREALQAHRRTRMQIELSKRYNRSSQEGEKLDQLAQMNDDVEHRGEEIVEELEQMMDQAQERLDQLDEQRMEELAERQRQISEQAEQLDEEIGEAAERFPMLQEQLGEPLEESRESMNEASESLEERRSQRALDNERAALEQLGDLKQQMQQALQKQRQQGREGGRGQRRDDVEIPGESSEERGQKLREDVMDAMKEEKLDEYESEIERYYKSIME